MTGDPTIEVVAAVIGRDFGDEKRFLVCRRPADKRHGGLWEFPGGKLEKGESVAEAVRRELREELGVVVVSVGSELFAARDPGSLYRIGFVAVEIRGTPRALEHDELRWECRSALEALPLAPSDRAFVESLR